MQLDKGREQLVKAVVQMLGDIDVYVEQLRVANEAMAKELRQNLNADRDELSKQTASLRDQLRSDHAAMADELHHDLDVAQTALMEARAAMSEQIAEFRVNVQAANQKTAREVRMKLNTERAALAAKTSKMMTDIDAFLAEIRSDAAGAADAWNLVKQLMADEDMAVEAAPFMDKEMPAPPAPVQMAASEPQASAPEMDALIEINGIGPSTQERLFAAGIKTFAQLASMDPDTLREVAGTAVTRRYNVEDWIEEARQRRSE